MFHHPFTVSLSSLLLRPICQQRPILSFHRHLVYFNSKLILSQLYYDLPVITGVIIVVLIVWMHPSLFSLRMKNLMNLCFNIFSLLLLRFSIFEIFYRIKNIFTYGCMKKWCAVCFVVYCILRYAATALPFHWLVWLLVWLWFHVSLF